MNTLIIVAITLVLTKYGLGKCLNFITSLLNEVLKNSK